MSTIIDNKGKQILDFFLENPTTEVHLRSLSRKLNISPTWIAQIAPSFNGLLRVRKDSERKMTLISANRDTTRFKHAKQCYNLSQLYDSGIVDELVTRYHKPEAIILFGSYSRGEDIEKSDIDIAVITSRQETISVEKFERKLKRKIKIIELQRSHLEPEFKNTLANGIIVYGYLTVAG